MYLVPKFSKNIHRGGGGGGGAPTPSPLGVQYITLNNTTTEPPPPPPPHKSYTIGLWS